jgi:hypothetical protein
MRKVTIRALAFLAVVLLGLGSNVGVAHAQPPGSTAVSYDLLDYGNATVCAPIYFFGLEIFCVPA